MRRVNVFLLEGVAAFLFIFLLAVKLFDPSQTLPLASTKISIHSLNDTLRSHPGAGLGSDGVDPLGITEHESLPDITDAIRVENLYEPDEDLEHDPVLTHDQVMENSWAITHPGGSTLPQMQCPQPKQGRYDHLMRAAPIIPSRAFRLFLPKPKYFFALDLWQVEELLPTLLSALYETIAFLGPENCVVSIVEGRSIDGTIDILRDFKNVLEEIGTKYHLTHNSIDPKDPENDRIASLSGLRNQALRPLVDHPKDHALDTIVTFINDIWTCAEDILEMLHQHVTQGADQMCGMDWFEADSFYDTWIARGMNGDTFFEISQDAQWTYAYNMFWNDKGVRERFDKMKPFQVFSCWNGITTLNAQPFLKKLVKFHRAEAEKGECYEGEPTVLARDFWSYGYGKIGVVPTVNVGYRALEEGAATKEVFGTVSKNLDIAAENADLSETIAWQREPPGQIKCFLHEGSNPVFTDTRWSKAPTIPKAKGPVELKQ